MSGGVFARAEGRTGTDFQSGEGAVLDGDSSVMAGEKESLAEAKLKRGGRAKDEFSNPPLEGELQLPEGANFGGVDLKNGR